MENRETKSISLEPLEIDFSICKVEDYSGIDLQQPFVFTGSTDQEKSLVPMILQISWKEAIGMIYWKRKCGIEIEDGGSVAIY